MVTYLIAKFKGWLALAGAIVLAMGIAFWKGRKAGKEAVTEIINKQNKELQDAFDKIDAQRPDFDGSIGRLRDRATDD